MTSCGPSNFECDGLHLNLLKNPKVLEVTHFASTQSCQLSKICGMTGMDLKQKKIKSYPTYINLQIISRNKRFKQVK